MLTEEQIQQFAKLYQGETGRDIDGSQALEMATKLVDILETVLGLRGDDNQNIKINF